MSLRCFYCNKECFLVHQGQLPKCVANPIPYWGIIARKCPDCQVCHWSTYKGELLFLTWSEITVNGAKFFAKVYHPRIPHRGPRFHLFRTYKDADGDLTWKNVMRWDFIPTWNPKNYQNKIQNCLAFL